MFNLGRLSLLDMVLGNFDRLVYITLDKEENRYKISDSEVNLGNIMLDWKDTEQNAPVLYVIDNSIHSEVLENPDACLALIEQFVAQPPAYHYIAEMMVISIQKALNSLSRDNKTMDPKKLQKMMKFFSKDLKKFGKDEINGGLNEMSKVLKSTLSTVWNKQEELRDYLEKTEPVKEKTESNEEKTRCSLYSLVSMNIEKFLSF
jgi:SpoVK/Ycf46/Vps4 family AAA+-type ATPase